MIFSVDILGDQKFIIENDYSQALIAARQLLNNSKQKIKELNKENITKIFVLLQKFIIIQEDINKLYLPKNVFWIKYVEYKIRTRTPENIELDDLLVKRYFELNKNSLEYKNIADYIETAHKIYNDLVYSSNTFLPNLYYSYYIEEVLLMWMTEYLQENFDLLIWILPLEVEAL